MAVSQTQKIFNVASKVLAQYRESKSHCSRDALYSVHSHSFEGSFFRSNVICNDV